MEERAIGRRELAGRPKHMLAMGGGRYPIITEDAETCLILAPGGARLRGFADIYEGEQHRARCLIVFAAPEGEYIRLTYKRRTAIRSEPPADYARGPGE